MFEQRSKRTATFLSDEPLEEVGQDCFGRRQFAEGIADSLAERTDSESVVVGIYGEWGSGKTTLLKWIAARLADRYVDCVRFNPWRFHDESTLLINFFTEIYNAISQSPHTRSQRVGQILKKYGSSAAALTLEFGSGAKLSPAPILQSIGEALSQDSLEKQKDRLSDALRERGESIIVLIDDIDRLDKNEVHNVFRLVKLVGSLPHIHYVLAFDHHRVAEAIADRYGSGSIRDGYSFIEKIVQVPQHVPSPSASQLFEHSHSLLERTLSRCGAILERKEEKSLRYVFQTTICPMIKTPRAAKRLSNAIGAALPLLIGEVNTVDIVLLESLRILSPLAFSAIREHPFWFVSSLWDYSPLDSSSSIKATAANAFPEGSNERELIIRLFPRIQSILRGKPNDQTDPSWRREKRVASEPYLQRYLGLAIPSEQASEAGVARVLDSVRSGSSSVIKDAFQAVVTQDNFRDFMLQINNHRHEIRPNDGVQLAQAIVESGDLLSGPFISGGPLSAVSVAINLVMSLLSTDEPKANSDIPLYRTIAHAIPLAFKVRCLIEIEHSMAALAAYLTVPEELAAKEAIIADIMKALSNGVLAMEAGNEFPELIFELKQDLIDPKVLNQFVQEAVTHGSEQVDYFLRFAQTEAREHEFSMGSYNKLVGLATPETIYAGLKQSQMSGLDSEDRDRRERFGRLFEENHPEN